MGFLTDIESCIASEAKLSGNDKNYLEEENTDTKVLLKTKGAFLNCDFEKLKTPLFPFFNDRLPDLCKISDNVLFLEKKGTPWCIIIELKNKKAPNKNQLLSTQCLVNYIVASTNRIYQKDYKPKIKFVGYSKKNRPTTKAKFVSRNDFIQIAGVSQIIVNQLLI